MVAAAVFLVGEMSTPGSFFLLPFAAGALVATLLAFANASVEVEAVAFLVVSVATFAALRPLARRLDRGEPTDGIGSKRLIGESATVLEPIPRGEHELGLVRVHREEWRAQSVDGSPIEAGTSVKVLEQRGTRLVVSPRPTNPDELES